MKEEEEEAEHERGRKKRSADGAASSSACGAAHVHYMGGQRRAVELGLRCSVEHSSSACGMVDHVEF